MTGLPKAFAQGIAAFLVCASSWAAVPVEAGEGSEAATFATVDDVSISVRDFEAAVTAAVRQKFYHRQPRADQLVQMRREVSDALVNRVLLVKEARRRGIAPDEDKVRAGLAAYERRVSNPAQWQHVLPQLKRALEEQSIVARLEAAARAVAQPSESEARAYYASHAELFTEPAQLRASVILLKVDPASPRDAWEQAAQDAAALVERLGSGAVFEDLARERSADATAAKGGDAGYLHRGMLPEYVEAALDKLEPGAVSVPMRVLEGVAVFRLTERKAARLLPLEEVRARLIERWQREQADASWRALVAGLRSAAAIAVDDGRVSADASANGSAGAGR